MLVLYAGQGRGQGRVKIVKVEMRVAFELMEELKGEQYVRRGLDCKVAPRIDVEVMEEGWTVYRISI